MSILGSSLDKPPYLSLDLWEFQTDCHELSRNKSWQWRNVMEYSCSFFSHPQTVKAILVSIISPVRFFRLQAMVTNDTLFYISVPNTGKTSLKFILLVNTSKYDGAWLIPNSNQQQWQKLMMLESALHQVSCIATFAYPITK